MCRLEQECQNQDIRKGKNALVEVYTLPNGQYGLRSTGVIGKECFIIEYLGEVINWDEMQRRKATYENEQHLYMMDFKNGQYIDAKNFGSVARFANHSCEANTSCYVINSIGEKRLAFYSERRIEIGEEITLNYSNQRTVLVYFSIYFSKIISILFYNFSERYVDCFCNTKSCIGRLPL